MGGLVKSVTSIFGGGGGGGSATAPDYAKLSKLADETKTVATNLGQGQIDTAAADYLKTSGVADPLAAKMAGGAGTLIDQGTDLAGYVASNERPVVDALRDEAMATGSDARQAEAAGRAVADTRRGVTSTQSMLMRQGLRYGFSPARMASAGTQLSVGQGLAEVTAANQARTAERDAGFAKKMAVQGIYAGQGERATTMVNTGTNTGGAAINATMAPASARADQVSQGANTILSGRQQAMQGITGMVSSQTSKYSADSAADAERSSSGMGMLGTVVGAGITVF